MSKSCKELLLSGQSVIFFPKGSSMKPLIREREAAVLVEPLKGEPKIGDILLFFLSNGKLVLHRLVGRNGECYFMLGDNSIGTEWIGREQILGVVSEIYCNGKVIRVTDRRYQVYVWIRVRTGWFRRAVYFMKRKGMRARS